MKYNVIVKSTENLSNTRCYSIEQKPVTAYKCHQISSTMPPTLLAKLYVWRIRIHRQNTDPLKLYEPQSRQQSYESSPRGLNVSHITNDTIWLVQCYSFRSTLLHYSLPHVNFVTAVTHKASATSAICTNCWLPAPTPWLQWPQHKIFGALFFY